MRNEFFIEIDFILGLLKPNSKKIFNEIILARKNKMWATIIVFSLTILDNIFLDEEYIELINALKLKKIKHSSEINWLRKKRNEILHFNDKKEYSIVINDQDLKSDSDKAYKILVKNLINLFPKHSYFD